MRAALILLAALLAAPACAIAPRAKPIPTADVAALEVAARVKTAILNDPQIGPRRIDVAVRGGEVTLSGRVANAQERDRAVELARAVPGVTSVVSELEITRSPS